MSFFFYFSELPSPDCAIPIYKGVVFAKMSLLLPVTISLCITPQGGEGPCEPLPFPQQCVCGLHLVPIMTITVSLRVSGCVMIRSQRSTPLFFSSLWLLYSFYPFFYDVS